MFEPAGFSVDLYEPPHTDVNQPIFMPHEEPFVIANHSSWSVLPEPKIGSFRYDENGSVNYINSGIYGNGYSLCLKCGRAGAQYEANKVSDVFYKDYKNKFEGHKKLRGRKKNENDSWCDAEIGSHSIQENIRFGTRTQTSVFELQLRYPNEPYDPVRELDIAMTVGYALRNALTSYIGIDAREVEVSVRDMQFNDGLSGLVLSLYDTASLGAGYVELLQDELIKLMEASKRYLDCPVNCDSACQHCLIDSSTQYKESLLDRHKALKWVNDWLNATTLPEKYQYFGDKSISVLSSIRHQIELMMTNKKITWVQFFIDYDEELNACDLSDCMLLQKTIDLVNNDVSVEWVLVNNDIDFWRDHCGNQLTAMMSMFGKNLSVKSLNIPNNINNGALLMGYQESGLFKYFISEDVDINIGLKWGESVNPIVTNNDDTGKLNLPVASILIDDLKPNISELSISLSLHRETDSDLHQFGNNFFNWLKQESSMFKDKISNNLKVSKVTYSDRYIRTPLNIILLYRIFEELANLTNSKNFEINITSMDFYEQKFPARIFHNFSNHNDRDDLLSSMLLKITDDVSITSFKYISEIAHYRNMTIEWDNGDTIDIIFDQGMGAWKYSGRCYWDTSNNISEQEEILMNDHGKAYMSEKWGTIITLKHLANS